MKIDSRVELPVGKVLIEIVGGVSNEMSVSGEMEGFVLWRGPKKGRGDAVNRN